MVIGYVPAGVVDVVVMVRTDWPEAVTDVGLNVPVAPVGNPLTLNVTALLKPLTGVMVTL